MLNPLKSYKTLNLQEEIRSLFLFSHELVSMGEGDRIDK
jgi:hypothetical protein